MPRTKTPDAPTVAQAFDALQSALREHEPACREDPRFTDDNADPAPLKLVCRACPLLQQCRTLALANPIGTTSGVFGIVGGLVCRPVSRYGRDDD